MQDLRSVTESATTLTGSLAGGSWSTPKVGTANEFDKIFIDDFQTTTKVSKNKYGMKLLKEF